jgi:hypothetical protein
MPEKGSKCIGKADFFILSAFISIPQSNYCQCFFVPICQNNWTQAYVFMVLYTKVLWYRDCCLFMFPLIVDCVCLITPTHLSVSLFNDCGNVLQFIYTIIFFSFLF